MNKKFRRKNKFDSHLIPVNTVTAILCAVVDLIIIIYMISRATITDGNVGSIIGLIGVVAIVISAYGIYYAFKGLKEDDNNYFTVPLITIIANILITVVLVVMYIVGIVLSIKG